MTALERAIELKGGLTALAQALEVKPQVVNNWRERGVPPPRCKDIERVTDGHVTCEELRPDVFERAA